MRKFALPIFGDQPLAVQKEAVLFSYYQALFRINVPQLNAVRMVLSAAEHQRVPPSAYRQAADKPTRQHELLNLLDPSHPTTRLFLGRRSYSVSKDADTSFFNGRNTDE